MYDLSSLVQRTPSATVELGRVYQRLVRHERPMPELGGWAMTSSTLVWVVDQIYSGRVSTIIECGSGSSTVWLALALEQRGADGRIVSLESSAEYAERTRGRLAELGLSHRALVLTAPLVDCNLPNRPTQPWFDLSALPEDLAGVDLLFVDGPLGNTSPQARYPALPVFADRLAADALVLLDDTWRTPERQIVQSWSAESYAGRRFAVTEELDRATVLQAVPAPADFMHWSDRSRGKPFAKDPSVVRFGDRYLMYFSVPPEPGDDRWGQAVAESVDLSSWTTIREVEPAGAVEARGICAGGAIVLDDRVHLFYQTYGNGADDAICHATSIDGVTFERATGNPIIRPTGAWTCGRAIDAELQVVGEELFCYWATRDPDYRIQMLGVHSAPLSSDLSAEHWRQRCSQSILRPELPWERGCIEAPTVCRRDDTLVMFYAGGYNNEPQQIGVAFSRDGLSWERMSDSPFLANGHRGEWNSSESGHPAVFVDPTDGATWLFFQGNDDNGRSWFISKRRIEWDGHRPRLA
jgi:predicted O-methyltransferase YrrM